MARFTVTVASRLSADQAFARIAAFERAPEWDPNTSEAHRVGEATGVGARFDITTSFGGRTLAATYRITTYEAPHRLVLESNLANVDLRDEISVAPTESGCDVTYDARLMPRGLWRAADPLLQVLFTRTCRRTEGPLASYLDGRTLHTM